MPYAALRFLGGETFTPSLKSTQFPDEPKKKVLEMKKVFSLKVVLSIAMLAGLYFTGIVLAKQTNEPQEPPVVDPGPVGGPPADAIVLFDGKDLSKFRG